MTSLAELSAHWGDNALPPDLEAIVMAMADGDDDDPFTDAGLRLLEPGEIPSIVAADYLSDENRQNADIMANVAAIADVSAMVAWVLEDEEGTAYGYWRGPERTPLAEAAIVWLDTEGQFYLPEGGTLAEVLAVEQADDDEHAYALLASDFAAVGVPLPALRADAADSPVPVTPPDQVHRERYEAHLRG